MGVRTTIEVRRNAIFLANKNNRCSQMFQTKGYLEWNLIEFNINVRHTSYATSQDLDRKGNGKAARYIHPAAVPGGRAEIEGGARRIVVRRLEKDKAVYLRSLFCMSNQASALREHIQAP